jgi:hypothetical protein
LRPIKKQQRDLKVGEGGPNFAITPIFADLQIDIGNLHSPTRAEQ